MLLRHESDERIQKKLNERLRTEKGGCSDNYRPGSRETNASGKSRAM